MHIRNRSAWRGLAALSLLLTTTAAHAQDSRELVYLTGSTAKVNQLTGDFDRQRQQPTLSLTGQRFGVDATDLGSSFEHKGQLYFLFGDTWGRPGLLDAIASTDSRDPARIQLDFALGSTGRWAEPILPGVGQGAFEIPSYGISVGGRMYVVFTANAPTEANIMGRSVLAVSEDDGKSFRVLYELSRRHFINVALWQSGDWIYIFGSGAYRKSSVSLARVRPGQIHDLMGLEYLSGMDARGRPTWSRDEEQCEMLFKHDEVGEFSVAFCEPVRRYVMLYNAGNPRGITMRSSLTPWGPWSSGAVIFEPTRDKGYGHFMHIAQAANSGKDDGQSDMGRQTEWGGEYGPYIMARFTRGNAQSCRIFYTMSTWNPYQVMVMQSDLSLRPSTTTN